MALTEVNGLWGFIRFVQHAKAAEIHPIAGANLITADGEAILLAENQTGYENLCRIISKVHEDDTFPIAKVLRNHSEGLFVLSHHEETLNALSRFLPDSHLFVELRPGVSEAEARRMAKKFHLETVATGDVYFLTREDHTAHRILRAIENNTTLTHLDPKECKSPNHWFRAEDEIIRLFPNSLEAINNSHYLAERCKTDWTFVNTIFPDRSLKETHQANRTLHELVYAGARKRYGELSQKVTDRIEYELNLITQKGFAPYFLIVRDIVRQTKATIGRGSAAASVVSYCLFITQVDPIKYHLQFERFIHPERTDMPDIDVDFPWDERDDILDYIFRKYGTERTAMVASQVFLRPRSAVREVGKVYGLSNEEIMSITKRIGYYRSRTDLVQWVKTDPRFANSHLDDTLLEVLKQSEKVVGAFRHPSVHPGGVVIVPDEIRKYVPVLMAPKGVQIVEWEKDQVEDSGLLKIDILGNRSLAVVRDTLKQINLNYGGRRKVGNHVNYHRIQPIGDPKTEALMKAGRTMGVFYIESPATRQLLAKAGVVDFEHVVIYSSIIRPAANRFTNIMLERIHGKRWEILHPDLEFLRESYGIMVYEEQVSMAARVMAGFGYSESDALRKTMSRDSLQHLIPGWKKKFYAGATQRGYSPSLIDQVWDMIASFVGYSFCKPHSASYAMLSFTCAYLKAHYPAEFLAAVISNQGGYYSAYAYLSEARRFGIEILPPDINRSRREYQGRTNKIRMGFMSIKNLQEKAVRAVLEERKGGDFQSLEDFLVRVDLDLSDAMVLTNASCFSQLPDRNGRLLTHREIAYRVAHFYLKNGEKDSFASTPLRGGLSEAEKRLLELETFGFPASSHPLTAYQSFLKGRVKKAKDIPMYAGKTIHLAGVYITRKETQTVESGDPMEFLTLEDETDIYECVLFPDTFRQYGDLLHWEKLFVLRGKVEETFPARRSGGGVYTITIEKLASLPGMVRKMEKAESMKLDRVSVLSDV
ncbi:MAG: DNA polymerase III subunit alpha [Candidatus Marinimicrobia bacterium]|nr:DNA polymerase III subunit alpha [Candidatus Neomarinimicrobiota bacterium]